MTATQPGKSPRLFGPGQLDMVLNTTNPTPGPCTDLQDMSLSFKRDLKSLQGRGQFTADVMAGSSSINWKATLGAITGRIPNDFILGAAPNSALTYNKALNESRTISVDGSSGAATVVNHGTGVYIRDLGVIDPATNLPLVRVASVGAITSKAHYYLLFGTPGRYIFHPSRVATKLLISYEWQGNVTGLGGTTLLTNQPQGAVGNGVGVFTFEGGRGDANVVTLNSIMASDFEWATKSGDFGKPTISGMAQPDPYGNIGTFSFSRLN